MRAFGTILLLTAIPANAQTTTQCIRNGVVTNCTTSPDQPSWTTLLPKPPSESVADYALRAEEARRQRERNQPNNDAREAINTQAIILRREERRREAYNQVGAIIARGDCLGAKRLADFYGVQELITATAKACPN